MNNKKILIPLLLVILVALSVSSVSASNATDVLAADEAADDVVAVDAVDEVVAASLKPATNDTAGVQNAIGNAAVGDIVDLSNFDSYDFAGNTINVTTDNLTIQGNGKTLITGYGDGNGLFNVRSNYVTFTGLNFVDTNPKNNLTYGGNVAGWGVRFDGEAGSTHGVVDNCTFKDFNQAVVVASSNYVTVKNSIFNGGIATLLINDPTVNKEKGSKTISVMGSHFLTVNNNIFNGPVLDGCSIAGGSGDAIISNNLFNGSVYAIFFGGASTEGTFIDNNVFDRCGIFQDGERLYGAFPVISIEKASDSISISKNIFHAVNENLLIAAQQGNTAHGYPSTLGNINVTDNTVLAADKDVVGASVTLLHILCQKSQLNPFAAIDVRNNELFDGVKAVVVWSTEWGTEPVYYGKKANNVTDIIIPKADLVATQIVVSDIAANGTVTAKLVDFAGKGINDESVFAIIEGITVNATTDKDGIFTIAGIPEKDMSIIFDGTEDFASSALNLTLPKSTVIVPVATSISTSGATIYTAASKVIAANLKLEDGSALADKVVAILIDGETVGFGSTDENGTFKVTVKNIAAGTHSIVAYFAGDNNTKASLDTAVLKVNKRATALTASKATLAVKKVKKIKVALKSAKKAVAGKKVTITVNGKTFTAKTNSKGIATISVKVLKKGKFTAAVKFAGDATYKAAIKKVVYVVK